MLKRAEIDNHVTLFEQLVQEVSPVTLVNTFRVEPEDADAPVPAGCRWG